MEARNVRPIIGLVGLLVVCAATTASSAASFGTKNFMVKAPTAQLAREIAEAAEYFRRELALEWLERELPPWSQPCPIVAQVGPSLGATGVTSFSFHGRQPYGWKMSVQGSRERVLDSVLPHEVTHTIFATHFGRPLPRWADEGACTTVEHESERLKQEQWLIRFLQTERGIPFNHLFRMTEYPEDMLPLYAQGYALASFLISQGGKPKFVQFVGEGMDTSDWAGTVERYYGYDGLGDLQYQWVDWIKAGRPTDIQRDNDIVLASATEPSSAQKRRPERTSIPDASQLASSDGVHVESWYVRQSRAGDSQFDQDTNQPRPRDTQGNSHLGPIPGEDAARSSSSNQNPRNRTTSTAIRPSRNSTSGGSPGTAAAAPHRFGIATPPTFQPAYPTPQFANPGFRPAPMYGPPGFAPTAMMMAPAASGFG
ncbi:MAG: hypothetical protein R3C28_20390 [Pirellulaceae bacterium]